MAGSKTGAFGKTPAHWPQLAPGDIVWCIVPYVDAHGVESLKRHPALVTALNDATRVVQVSVFGGASLQPKQPVKSTDLAIYESDPWFDMTGLHHNTVFHLDESYLMLYTDAYFVEGVSGSPWIGKLDAKHPKLRQRLTRALMHGK
jgi:hypothetical protein